MHASAVRLVCNDVCVCVKQCSMVRGLMVHAMVSRRSRRQACGFEGGSYFLPSLQHVSQMHVLPCWKQHTHTRGIVCPNNDIALTSSAALPPAEET